jgi:Ca-activated chloride channel family protein
MSFENPLALLGLLVLPAAVGLFLLARRRHVRYALRYPNLGVLAGVVSKRDWHHYLAPGLVLLALASLVVGAARPTRQTREPVEQATVILVLDVSNSMNAKDVYPSRLLAARDSIRFFLSRIPERVRVGLIYFAVDAQVGTAPTSNHQLIRASLDANKTFVGFSSTSIGDALALAVKIGLRAIGGSGGDPDSALASKADGMVSILFLSDGSQTSGTLEPLQGANLAKQAGIPIYAVALGSNDAEGFFPDASNVDPPDDATLQLIAKVTGGEFFKAQTSTSLRSVYAGLGSRLGYKRVRHEIAALFVLLGAVLLTAAGFVAQPRTARLP